MGLMKRLTCVPAFWFVATCAYGEVIHCNHDRAANFANDGPGNTLPIDPRSMFLKGIRS